MFLWGSFFYDNIYCVNLVTCHTKHVFTDTLIYYYSITRIELNLKLLF